MGMAEIRKKTAKMIPGAVKLKKMVLTTIF